MTDVLHCPRCDEQVTITGQRPRAEEFCPRCDYPVFFARQGLAAARSTSAGRLRLPGTGGAADTYGRACPTCAEPNDLEAVVCRRCGGPMVLAPPPPPAPEPEPVVAPPPPPPYVAPRPIAPFLVLLAVAVVVIGTLLVTV